MWAFFKFNDLTIIVDACKFQRTRCILCHNVKQEEVHQTLTQSKKGLVMYNKDHGTIAMNCDVTSKHFIILKSTYIISLGGRPFHASVPSSVVIHPSIHPRQRGGGRRTFLNCKTPLFQGIAHSALFIAQQVSILL